MTEVMQVHLVEPEAVTWALPLRSAWQVACQHKGGRLKSPAMAILRNRSEQDDIGQ